MSDAAFKIRSDAFGGYSTPKASVAYPVPFDWHNVATPFRIQRNVFGDYPYTAALLIPPPEPFPSEAYKLAIAQPMRQSYITGTITTLLDGAVDITDDAIVQGSLQIAAEISVADHYISGGVPSLELQVTLNISLLEAELYNAEIALSFWILLADGTPYEVPLGTFIVQSAERDSEHGIHITAYDDMMRLTHIKRSSLGIAAETYYSPFELVLMCAEKAGITFEMTADDFAGFVNHDLRFEVYAADSSLENARDLLMHVMQIIGCFAYVDRWRKLQIRQLGQQESTRTVGNAGRIRSTFSRIPYRLQELSQDITTYDGGKSSVLHVIEETLWTDGVQLHMQENPLWATLHDAQRDQTISLSIRRLGERLSDYQYRPCETAVYGDPALTIGEWVTYTGGEAGGGVSAPLTAFVWNYHGEQTLTSCGMDAVAAIAKTQAQKQLSANRDGMIGATDNLMHEAYAQLMRSGYLIINTFRYMDLEKFRYSELQREES